MHDFFGRILASLICISTYEKKKQDVNAYGLTKMPIYSKMISLILGLDFTTLNLYDFKPQMYMAMQNDFLEYSYSIRTFGSERVLFFYRCTAERALVSRMLPSWQYFHVPVKENERDAKFTRSDFKNKLRVLYFIHYNSFLIYWEFTSNA